MDDFRVADILALSGHRHQQVVAHQPLHQFRVTVVQSVALAEAAGDFFAYFRVVAAAALGYVVHQGRDVK